MEQNACNLGIMKDLKFEFDASYLMENKINWIDDIIIKLVHLPIPESASQPLIITWLPMSEKCPWELSVSLNITKLSSCLWSYLKNNNLRSLMS